MTKLSGYDFRYAPAFMWVQRLGRILSVCCFSAAVASSAQTFQTLVNFDSSNGANPYAALFQSTDGNLYGTTVNGGANSSDYCTAGCGTVFKMTPAGSLDTLYDFCSLALCFDGYAPYGGLIQASDGNYYGATTYGGSNGNNSGEVFELSTSGLQTWQIFFPALNNPVAGLIQGLDGYFYLTTPVWGVEGGGIFKFKPEAGGNYYEKVWKFSDKGVDAGGNPEASLMEGPDRNFYGTTQDGYSENQEGAIYKFTSEGKGDISLFYSFCALPNCADGELPKASLILGSDGDFYGTTTAGGANGYGTVFKISSAGVLTTLYSFCSSANCSDGANPVGATLVEGSDGNFYGTTGYGGASVGLCGGSGCGTVFEMSPNGSLTTLHSFQGTDGEMPYGGLIQDTNGVFYGTTVSGGSSTICDSGCGTVFSLSAGLGPFVQTQQDAAPVGSTVAILGTNLSGASVVSFDGVKAKFEVVSDSEITADVPRAALTGALTVVTPTGTLSSRIPFRVLPGIASFSPTSGPVGTQVQITGPSLLQTTSVAFDGMAASQFTVNSDREVTATVPVGASTGKITITTLGGSVTSGKSYNVTN
ncbi:MAG: choice-of-anchor tandem repeat GloVer-containing protein [Terriglobales bacterium]|jgi:uncharacterized repeat protein (TIGR03803 family)